MVIQQIPVQPMYKKENGMYVVDLNAIPHVKNDTFSEQAAIVMPPGVIGGNHKHKRVEAFISLHKGLYIYWLEPDGSRQSLPMMGEGNQLLLTFVPSLVAHAVKNTHQTENAVLIEYADQKPAPVERVIVIQP